MRKVFLVLMLGLFAISLIGCGSSAAPTAANSSASSAQSSTSIQIETPWIHSAANGSNTVAFMVIKNTSGQEDKLIKAEASVSKTVSLMNTEMKDGQMTVQDVSSITVPANGQVELKSGSYYILLMGLIKDLKEGDNVPLTLTFEKAGKIQLNVSVKSPAIEQ